MGQCFRLAKAERDAQRDVAELKKGTDKFVAKCDLDISKIATNIQRLKGERQRGEIDYIACEREVRALVLERQALVKSKTKYQANLHVANSASTTGSLANVELEEKFHKAINSVATASRLKVKHMSKHQDAIHKQQEQLIDSITDLHEVTTENSDVVNQTNESLALATDSVGASLEMNIEDEVRIIMKETELAEAVNIRKRMTIDQHIDPPSRKKNQHQYIIADEIPMYVDDDGDDSDKQQTRQQRQCAKEPKDEQLARLNLE